MLNVRFTHEGYTMTYRSCYYGYYYGFAYDYGKAFSGAAKR